MSASSVAALVEYARRKELLPPEDLVWARNSLLEILKLDSYEDQEVPDGEIDLPALLNALTEDALARGVLQDDSPLGRDLFDTSLMGRVTPAPSQVIRRFFELYALSPQQATDWYYRFCGDINYIRRDRIARDVQWKADTEYGQLDITINLSKPEKDPRAIAAARNAAATAYPKCQLCRENEGYAGRLDHPARQNLRLIPLTIHGQPWFLQYSP